MSRLARALVLFVIVFHFAAFSMEAVLWMRPEIHERMLKLLVDPGPLRPVDQALILKRLFVNQGFYNLFLATAGMAGLAFLRRGNATVGTTLIAYMCVSAVGAGIVLALSTGAYPGAFLQAMPAAGALFLIFRARSANGRA